MILTHQDMIPVDKRSTVDSSEILPPDYTPSPHAVLSGKGKTCFNHLGNVEFRSLLQSVVPGYQLLKTKQEKTYVLSYIVENIKALCDDNIGFVRKDSNNGRWYELSDDAAREKVGFTLRQAAKIPLSRQRGRPFQAMTKLTFDKGSSPVVRPTMSKNKPGNAISSGDDDIFCNNLDMELVFPTDRCDISRWLKLAVPPATEARRPIQDCSIEELLESESKDFANPFFQDVRREESILRDAWLILSL